LLRKITEGLNTGWKGPGPKSYLDQGGRTVKI